MKKRYQVQVSDGRIADTAEPHIVDSCGHKHRTKEAALKCLIRTGGTTSPRWWNASVRVVVETDA